MNRFDLEYIINKNIELFSIRDIAAWELTDIPTNNKTICGIPSYQRGLVWKANQVELLWDSMLRGFPIGSILVSNADETVVSQQRYDSDITQVTHHIVDGQQRSHNIALGFYDPFKSNHQKKEYSYLWIDLAYSGTQSTREHLLRLVTPSHPWGYKDDDDASRLPYHKISHYMEKIKKKDKSTNSDRKSKQVLSCKSFPVESIYPVPMTWLLEFSYNAKYTKDVTSLKSFLQGKSLTKENSLLYTLLKDQWEANKEKLDQNDTYLIKLIENIKTLCHETLIPVIHIGEKDITSLEILFQRVNQLGTRLEGLELRYSLIKAHWGDIVKNLENAAQNAAIHPAYLCIQVFRLIAQENSKYMKEPDISSIRKKASEDDSIDNKDENAKNFSKEIRKYILTTSELDKNVDTINLLSINEYKTNYNFKLPPVLKTYIARDSRDVYYWLLHVAKSFPNVFKKDELLKKILGIVTAIDFFGVDKGVAVKRLFEHFSHNDNDMNDIRSYKGVLTKLYEKVSNKQGITHIYSGDQLDNDLLTLNQIGQKSNSLQEFIKDIIEKKDEYEFDEVWPFIYRLVRSKKLLIYAQRKYVLDEFEGYDAFSSYWIDKNRPWDYDHILPSKIFYGKRHDDYPYKWLADQWINTIGNLRILHFSDNRSRQFSLLKKNDDHSDFFINNDNIDYFNFDENAFVKDHDKAFDNTESLVKAVKARLLVLYNEWWDTLEIEQLI